MFGKILEHKITLTIGVILFVGVAAYGGYRLLAPVKQPLTLAEAQTMTIQEEVTAQGNVDSDQHVSLSFPATGRISAVNVKVGDAVHTGEVLAAQEAGQLRASLASAEADVQSAQAGLSSTQKGATDQTLAVYQQGVSTAKLGLATADRDAYLKVQDAFVNKLNPLFTNNTSSNPTLNIIAESSVIANNLDQARAALTQNLTDWNTALAADPTGDSALSEGSATLTSATTFIGSLSAETSRLTIGNSGTTQAVIDADVAAVTGAAGEINDAQTSFNSALQAYKTANDQLSVVQASSTPEALQISAASLAKAQANVGSIQSQLADTMLVAPWDGIVASVNPKVGDSFTADEPAIDIISPGAYKIDILIPENKVAAVSIGDSADISFDAYGAAIAATGTVSSIDLSPTVTDGVSAYKATVYLSSADPRIRTGMTGNVTVEGLEADNVVAVPTSAIVEKNDGSYVLIPEASGDSYTEQEVTTGVSGNGWTEIVSGLAAGQQVAAFGQE